MIEKTKALIELCYPLFDKIFFTEPIGLIALSAYLKREGYSVHVNSGFLYGLSCEESAERVLAKQPFMVGISINCAREVEDGLRFAKYLREKGYKGYCVAGGDFAGFHRDELVDANVFNAIILGEGEEPFCEMLDAIFSGRGIENIDGIVTYNNRTPKTRENISDLDSLPFLDRGVLQEMIIQNGGSVDGIQASVSTSRGCYGGCAFCSIWKGAKLNKGKCFREFSIPHIVSEIDDIYRKYGVYDFYLCSAQFLPGRKELAEQRMIEMSSLISELEFRPSLFLYLRCDNVTGTVARCLVESGVTTVFIGVESFDDRILKKLRKGLTSEQIKNALNILQDYGFSSYYRSKHRMKLGFIMFTEWTDLNSLRINLKGCREFKIPPKKMVYTLQVHKENELDNVHTGGNNIFNIEFNDVRNDVGYVRNGYLRVLNIILPQLETMRAYQKAKLAISSELYEKTWSVVDAINSFAYDAFEQLIDIADSKEYRLFEELLDKAMHLKESIRFNEVIEQLNNESPKERISCVESHLERGMDNPQIWTSEKQSVKTPLIGRMP